MEQQKRERRRSVNQIERQTAAGAVKARKRGASNNDESK